MFTEDQITRLVELGLWSDIGFVYCIENLTTNDCKIGWAVNPCDRIRRLRTGNDSPIALVDWFPGNRRTEAAVHRHLKDRRLLGEWFANDDGKVTRWFLDQKPVAIRAYKDKLIAKGYFADAA